MSHHPQEAWHQLHAHLRRSDALIDELYAATNGLSEAHQPHAAGFASTYREVCNRTSVVHPPAHCVPHHMLLQVVIHAMPSTDMHANTCTHPHGYAYSTPHMPTVSSQYQYTQLASIPIHTASLNTNTHSLQTALSANFPNTPCAWTLPG